jgi:hypothetical protein
MLIALTHLFFLFFISKSVNVSEDLSSDLGKTVVHAWGGTMWYDTWHYLFMEYKKVEINFVRNKKKRWTWLLATLYIVWPLW